MTSHPNPGPGRCVVGAARVVRGPEWIDRREQQAFPLVFGDVRVTWEAVWWAQALDKLHDELRQNALLPGAGIERHVLINEADRSVTLFVETVAREPDGPHMEWGLPLVARQVPLPPCPPGGDLLVLPPWQ